nr:acetylxylan esterase [Marinicella sp. W31]MDC2875467.1 acetylxylan esterase [Marinicella sp. W31]
MPDEKPAGSVVKAVGERVDCGTHGRQDFIFEAEPGAEVPCVMLLPKNVEGPLPVMICLQGHTTGMHISLGEVVHGCDVDHIGGDRDFAIQAVNNGYAAIAMEQRAFGIRGDGRADCCRRTLDLPINDDNRTCKHPAMTALLLGRTLLGERVFDVIRACDAVAEFEFLDPERIHVMGNSGGGTVAWYAAALEPRLKGIIAASCFCTVARSIGAIDHCTDNYIPGMLEWFDFPDIAAAIDDTKVLIVMGRHDPLFPYEGVQEAFATAEAIFERLGKVGAIKLVIGEGGHRFYSDDAWPAFAGLLATKP